MSSRIGSRKQLAEKLVYEAKKRNYKDSSFFLEAAGFSSHNEYIRSEAWRNTRARYIESGMSMYCFICNTKKNVNLHHITYIRLPHEKLTDLIPLCWKHHNDLHEFLSLYRLPVEFSIQAIRLLMNWSRMQMQVATQQYTTRLITTHLTASGYKVGYSTTKRGGLFYISNETLHKHLLLYNKKNATVKVGKNWINAKELCARLARGENPLPNS